uniref:Tenascin Cb n=1 Tax=Cyclopterus lumpus TaxID=8103 RepID=A0A8C2YY67_CYCLU
WVRGSNRIGSGLLLGGNRRRVIAFQWDALAPTKTQENLTLPHPDQPVVFNHVYNINVPTTSLCSGAPMDMQNTEHMEHTVDGDNQIVFTHRINIPKQACGCDNQLGLKDILNRLEMLESELSSLREQCSSGTGCCGSQVTGNTDTCSCICEPGWKGPNCTEPECPNDCQDQGRCVDGKCECFEGFGGFDCSELIYCGELTCPNDCLDRGRCVDGQCVCHKGFTGEDCSEKTCPKNCLDRGYCVDGDCVCYEGFTGPDCSMLTCPNDCLDQGHCENGVCMRVTEYLITYVPTAPGGLELDARVPGDQKMTTIRELEPGVEYLISVYAVLNNKRSLPVSARVATRMSISPVKEEDGEILNSLGRPETTFEQSGLGPGQEYEVKLEDIGINSCHCVASPVIDAPSQVDMRDVTDTTALLTWFQPVAEVDGVSVSYGPSSNPADRTVVELSFSDTQYHLGGLIPDTQYEVSLLARRGERTSIPVYQSFLTDLDAPRDLQTVELTDESITLEWKNSQAPVENYRIKYGPLSGGEHGDSESHILRGLTPGMLYTVSIIAERGRRTSAPATVSAPTDVDAPQDLAASNIQTENGMLTWKPPRADITGYILSFEAADGTIRVSGDTRSPQIQDASTEYSVKLQAIAGPKRSRVITTVFTTTGVLYRFPRDCSQALLNGDTTSDLYTIYLGGDESQPVQVYCDMSIDGGGWIVFLRRQSGRLEFFRNWKNYTAGFGDMNDEFWLGLSNLHKITAGGQYELRVDLRDKGETAYAQYDKFSISEPRSRYKVHVGGYSGTAGDSMTYHHGRPFSTYDHDNDIAVTNCALSYKGAFWYKNCHRVNLMGRYGDNSHSKGVNWFHWKGHEHSIEFAEMKIRPSNFRNLEGRRKRS